MGEHRKRPQLEIVRERIGATKLLQKLERFALGEINPVSKKVEQMTMAQVSAAAITLRKAVPDLQAIEHSGEVKQVHTVSAEPMSTEEWAATYGSERAVSH